MYGKELHLRFGGALLGFRVVRGGIILAGVKKCHQRLVFLKIVSSLRITKFTINEVSKPASNYLVCRFTKWRGAVRVSYIDDVVGVESSMLFFSKCAVVRCVSFHQTAPHRTIMCLTKPRRTAPYRSDVSKVPGSLHRTAPENKIRTSPRRTVEYGGNP